MSLKPAIKFTFLLLLANIALAAVQHHGEHKHGCSHNHYPEEPRILEVEELPLHGKIEGRSMATVSYPQIRIKADYSNLNQGGDVFIDYIQNSLVPLIIDYFQASLKVKQPLTSPLKLPSSYSTICGFNVPQPLQVGSNNTDLYLIVSATNDSSSNWVASAGSCYLSSGNKRPVVAKMNFNYYYTSAPGDDPLLHEKNMYLTMHEMIHALGFTWSNMQNFIDSNGNTLSNQFKYVTLEGVQRTILDVEPLTSMLRTYFGCSSLPGVYLEDDGGSGTANTHFERRHFLYEAMTSGVIQGLRISKFSFALLEGSGWYVPDYSYVDPFFVGQGEGCGFLTTNCSSPSILNYDEFCSGSGRGCGNVGTSGGVCSTDANADGCRYYIPVLQYYCQSPDASQYARVPTREVYDRFAGSMCFNGNISTSKSASNTSLCFTYTCQGSGITTSVVINFGSTKYTCKSAGPITVSGYNGVIQCPDPLTFCSTTGAKYCPRNCMGRGTCVNNACVCKAGFQGVDCALNV